MLSATGGKRVILPYPLPVTVNLNVLVPSYSGNQVDQCVKLHW